MNTSPRSRSTGMVETTASRVVTSAQGALSPGPAPLDGTWSRRGPPSSAGHADGQYPGFDFIGISGPSDVAACNVLRDGRATSTSGLCLSRFAFDLGNRVCAQPVAPAEEVLTP